jgi:hypothetical protein
MPLFRLVFVLLIAVHCGSPGLVADDGKPVRNCLAANSFRDSWIKVGERICMKCHVAGGDAADSDFRLSDKLNSMENVRAFTTMAMEHEQDGRA